MSAAVKIPVHLDLIAAAPAGIQKLRGLILELAVRGKLVPQDPNDEPATARLRARVVSSPIATAASMATSCPAPRTGVFW